MAIFDFSNGTIGERLAVEEQGIAIRTTSERAIERYPVPCELLFRTRFGEGLDRLRAG
ncbi:MAG: hypothetical protein HOH33_15125 [Verrucomicrobia bacterium]|nr:hypothetical protein [Verrucomicrobiota bacterium]